MAINLLDNFCTRCGKQRVVVKTYKEKIGNSVVIYTEKACPDPECQKRVNTQLTSDESKRRRIKSENVKREQERQQLKKNSL